MRTTRSLAAAAASIAVSAVFVLGLAVPAQAGPNPNPSGPAIASPTPITPYSPVVYPFPSGTTPAISYFTIPNCTDMVTATAINATRALGYPTFGAVTTPSGVYGAADPALTAIMAAQGGTTCSFSVKSAPSVVVTETRVTSAQYWTIKAWYDAHNTSSTPGGGPVWSGGAHDTHYMVGEASTPFGVGPSEVASISPNGWWITVRDAGRLGAQPYFEMDTVEHFFGLNPALWLITY